MNNKYIRIALINNDLKQYQLAQLMKTHEGSVSRMLKNELPEAEKERILKLIDEYAENGGQEND